MYVLFNPYMDMKKFKIFVIDTLIKNFWPTFFFIIFIFVVVGVIGTLACTRQFDYIEDNIVEEIVEDVIEQKTGIKIDVTPATPEAQSM